MDKDPDSPIAYEEAKEMASQSCTISDDHSLLLLSIISSEALLLNSTADMAGTCPLSSQGIALEVGLCGSREI